MQDRSNDDLSTMKTNGLYPTEKEGGDRKILDSAALSEMDFLRKELFHRIEPEASKAANWPTLVLLPYGQGHAALDFLQRYIVPIAQLNKGRSPGSRAG